MNTILHSTICKQKFLDFVKPYALGSGRFPTTEECNRLEEYIGELAQQNPHPVLQESFDLLAGTWKCLFTTSRYVLDLDKIPLVHLSSVYQTISIDHEKNAGHYVNIAELSYGPSVKMVCGEYASIQPSVCEPGRVHVHYRYAYVALRLLSAYEGHEHLVTGLEANQIRQCIRFPFDNTGWQTTAYLDKDMRIAYGNKGGIFVLTKNPKDLERATAPHA